METFQAFPVARIASASFRRFRFSQGGSQAVFRTADREMRNYLKDLGEGILFHERRADDDKGRDYPSKGRRIARDNRPRLGKVTMCLCLCPRPSSSLDAYFPINSRGFEGRRCSEGRRRVGPSLRGYSR